MDKEYSDSTSTCEDYEKRISLLVSELKNEYSESLMYELSCAYLFSGDCEAAKRTARKCLRLFPTGEYAEDMQRIIDVIGEGSEKEYIREHSGEAKTVSLLSDLYAENSVIAEIAEVPCSISECFDNVVGMENAQVTLGQFLKLLSFESKRKQNNYATNLIDSTHFIIAGDRGSGKTLVSAIIAEILFKFGRRKFLAPVNYTDSLFSGNSYIDKSIVVENFDLLVGKENVSVYSEWLSILKTHNTDCSIIINCSKETEQAMIGANPDFKDAVFAIIEIEQYTDSQLLQILERIARKKGFYIHDDAKKVIEQRLTRDRRGAEFMNGITLGRYIDEAMLKMAERVYLAEDTTDEGLACLKYEDFAVTRTDEKLSELLNELDSMIGLAGVKAQVRKRIESVIAEAKLQKQNGEKAYTQWSLHMIFTGNPGTGKTTIAEILGKIYKQLGILSNGDRIVYCTRSDLVGQYQGHTAIKVKEKLHQAMGGILFIDEAYSLCRDDGDSFGHEAVDELIAGIENNKDSIMVILAGYKEEMANFLKSNPGFRSRIRNEIEFEDYSIGQLIEIFKYMAYKNGITVESNAYDALESLIEFRSRHPGFGNARGVRNVFDDVMEARNSRIVREDVIDASYITHDDIVAVSHKTDTECKNIDQLIAQLDGMIGLATVKQVVHEQIDSIQVKKLSLAKGISAKEDVKSLHMIFKGNAGTGKTTIARMIGKIYQYLEVLPKNTFIETDRSGLVGRYQGETAKNVKRIIDEADGGILFIDEAYALLSGENDEYGKEALSTLIAQMENKRERLMVILAGYGPEMDRFISSNQGLASRFSTEIIFEDYSDDELVEIFKKMATQQNGLIVADELNEVILQTIVYGKRNISDFGNARGVRNLLQKVMLKRDSRIAQKIRNGENVEKEEILTIVKEDFAIWKNC